MVKKEKRRVNIKARLNRHLRIVKENIGVNSSNNSNESKNHHYGIVIFVVLLVLPIYPTFASFFYNTSRYEFYRGNIDESSIIKSYYGGDEKKVEELNSPIFESTDSFISVQTILNDERNLEGNNEIVDYEVKPGESFSVIAFKFKVSTNSILWANNFDKKHTLQPGEVIKIPPVSGLIHQVQKGENISQIAKKYDIEESKIIEQNGLNKDNILIVGDILTIPGAIKKVPKRVYKKPRYKKPKYKKPTYGKSKGSQYTNQKGEFKLVWRKPYSGVWGNCTYYVASYINVNWRGNANRWMVNAKAKGQATGSVAKIGSIVQFTGRGYNPRYGHVAIVMDIKDDYIIVSEMNYRRLNEVTYRKVFKNDRAIDGYIYIK